MDGIHMRSLVGTVQNRNVDGWPDGQHDVNIPHPQFVG